MNHVSDSHRIKIEDKRVDEDIADVDLKNHLFVRLVATNSRLAVTESAKENENMNTKAMKSEPRNQRRDVCLSSASFLTSCRESGRTTPGQR